MKLRRIPEAFKAGWSAFRATLFLPQYKTTQYIGEDRPSNPKRGDIWIKMPEMELHCHTGRRWKTLKYNNKEPFQTRYLTWFKK